MKFTQWAFIVSMSFFIIGFGLDNSGFVALAVYFLLWAFFEDMNPISAYRNFKKLTE